MFSSDKIQNTMISMSNSTEIKRIVWKGHIAGLAIERLANALTTAELSQARHTLPFFQCSYYNMKAYRIANISL